MNLWATKPQFWGWFSFQSPKLLLVHISRWAKVSSAWKLRHAEESEQSFISALRTVSALTIFTFHLLSVRHRLLYSHLSVRTNHEFNSFLPYCAGKFPDCFSQAKMPSCHQSKHKKHISRAAAEDARGLLVRNLHPRALRIIWWNQRCMKSHWLSLSEKKETPKIRCKPSTAMS